ncbi:MAG: thiamine pyrophosphate-dependent enzyme [Candidatus Moduliflexus flocculans]|nr:thiamine pyrophosphate-dependent enzyme [Candidatus Moduliflexus flocculans]
MTGELTPPARRSSWPPWARRHQPGERRRQRAAWSGPPPGDLGPGRHRPSAPVLPHQRHRSGEPCSARSPSGATPSPAQDTAATVQRALDIDRRGRPGPVYLALPGDVGPHGRARHRPRARPVPGAAGACPDRGRPTSTRAARMISEARKPLALVGIGVDPTASAPQPSSAGSTPRDPRRGHPSSEGSRPGGPSTLRGHLHRAWQATGSSPNWSRRADLLVGVGFDPHRGDPPFHLERPSSRWPSTASQSGVVRPRAGADRRRPRHARLRSAARPRPLPRLDARGRSPRFRQRLAAFLTPSLDRTRLGLLPPARLFGRLRDLTPRDAILTVDTGAHKLLVGQIWRSYQPQTYLVSHGLSTMGQALPAALAAKLVHPDRAVVAVHRRRRPGHGPPRAGNRRPPATCPSSLSSVCDRSLHLIRLRTGTQGVSRGRGVDFGPIDFAGIAPGFGVAASGPWTWPEFDAAVTRRPGRGPPHRHRGAGGPGRLQPDALAR